MAEELEAVLEDCWQVDGIVEGGGMERTCRWCRQRQQQGHHSDCPCAALARAIQQRDALAAYIKAERRSHAMQGAVRLAQKANKSDVRHRLDEAVLQLEAAQARLRELGIEGMVR